MQQRACTLYSLKYNDSDHNSTLLYFLRSYWLLEVYVLNDVSRIHHSNTTGTCDIMEDIFINEQLSLNHSSSTKNAELHCLVTAGSLIGSIVVSNALRSEAIVVWQQLVPLQLLPFITTLLESHLDCMHPINEPSEDLIEAELLQPMATNMFSYWEKMKGLFASSTFSFLLELSVQLESVG